MSIMFPDAGCLLALKKFFKNVLPAGGNNYTLKLYTNNITPATGDAATDYAEAVDGGYAAKTLTAATFNDPTVVGGIAQITYPQQSFAFTGPLTAGGGSPVKTGTIYGYYVVDGDGILVFAERSTTAFTPAIADDGILLTPKFQFSYGTPVA